MQESEFDIETEDSAGTTGMKWLGRVIAVVIILIVAAFGDVMYIQLMMSKFPVGPLLIVCYIGAFTSFLAVVYMLIGKSVLFTPGRQITLAWLIFAAELALIAMNIILVFQADGQGATGFLAAWLQLAPATPVLNMAGVAILFFLDEDGKMHHEDVELAYEMKRSNRRYVKSMHKARLRLQNKQLNFLITELDRAVAAPESMLQIQQTAIDLNTKLLGQLSGGRVYNQSVANGRQIVTGTLAAASTPATQPVRRIQTRAAQPATQPAPKKRVTTPLQRIAKRLPPMRRASFVHTETLPVVPPQQQTAPTVEVEEPANATPLAPNGIPIKQNRGSYIVNRKASPIKLND